MDHPKEALRLQRPMLLALLLHCFRQLLNLPPLLPTEQWLYYRLPRLCPIVQFHKNRPQLVFPVYKPFPMSPFDWPKEPLSILFS